MRIGHVENRCHALAFRQQSCSHIYMLHEPSAMKALASALLAVLAFAQTACTHIQYRNARVLADNSEYSLAIFLRPRGVTELSPDGRTVHVRNTPEARRALLDFESFSRTYLEVIENNIINADATRRSDGRTGPYRRKWIILDQQGIVREIREDSRPVPQDFARYEPEHPDANSEGYVIYPDVDIISEMNDMVEANHQRNIAMELLRRFDPDLVVPERPISAPQLLEQRIPH